MAPKPFFSEIGKKAKDLLTGDYAYTNSLKVTTVGDGGVTFAANAAQKAEVLTADVKATLKTVFGSQVELKMDSTSKLGVTVTNSSLLPGLKTVVSGAMPDSKSGKLELKYTNDLVAISTVVGLTGQPKVEASCATGHGGFLVGAEVGVDTVKNALTKYGAGVGYQAIDYNVGILICDKLETLKASYVHALGMGKSVVGEVAYSLSKGSTGIAIGGQMALDGGVAKMRVDSKGCMAFLFKSDYAKGVTCTLSAEVDAKQFDKPAKLGLGIAIKA